MNLYNITSYDIILPMEAWQTGVLTLADEHKEIINRQVKDFLEFISK